MADRKERKAVIHKRRLPRLYKGDAIEGQKIACRHTALEPRQVIDRGNHLDIVLAYCLNCGLYIQVPGLD